MHPYREIGRGTFGVVFCSQDQPDTAVKKTFKSRETLAEEFDCGLRTSFAVTTTAPILQDRFSNYVPRVPWYQSSHGMQRSASDDLWWIENRRRLPTSNGDNVPTGVFLFERIPPVPRPLQEILIRRFWTPDKQQAALDEPENRDCMIRPYLQERWAYYQSKGKKRLNNEQQESLRNFPAYLDDLESMGIDCHLVARQIALSLAVGHWEAQHDMTDVEFVIAGRRNVPSVAARGNTVPLSTCAQPGHIVNRDITCGDASNWTRSQPEKRGLPAKTEMWLVDFDKCHSVRVWEDTLAQDIRKLALGICANDPYYPSPLPDTRFGWEVFVSFSETYIQASQHLLRHAFEKVATRDEQMQKILQRPVLVMRSWTKIVMDAKKNNERELFDSSVALRKEEGWPRPAWSQERNTQ